MINLRNWVLILVSSLFWISFSSMKKQENARCSVNSFSQFCILPAVFIFWSSDMQNMWAPHQVILHCLRKAHMAETCIISLALQWPVLPPWKIIFYFPNFCFLIYKLGYYQLPISTSNRGVANVWKLYTKSYFFPSWKTENRLKCDTF